jgi:hypothetical protein
MLTPKKILSKTIRLRMFELLPGLLQRSELK